MKKGHKKSCTNVGDWDLTAPRFPNLDKKLTREINQTVNFKEKIYVIADFTRVQSLYFFTKSGSVDFEIAIRTVAVVTDRKVCPKKIQPLLFDFVTSKRSWLMNTFSDYFHLCDIPPLLSPGTSSLVR